MREQDDPLAGFRAGVRDFIERNADQEIREAGRKMTSFFAPFEPAMRWHRILHRQGWAAPSWPKQYGGTGWSPAQQKAFEEECRAARLPRLLPQGLSMVGPAIMRFGSEAQKRRHLPGIVSGEDFWTQGYSEPGAGSDLASLSCRADRHDDHYRINGSKTWTTYAHHANRMFLLVRTDRGGKPQQGISFFLLDNLDLPGLEIRPIIGLDGIPEQCDVFFDDVRVPLDACLGAENDGWTVAKYLLEHERGGSSSFAAHFEQELRRLRQLAEISGDGFGGCLADDPIFQHRFANLWAEVAVVDATEARFAVMEKGSSESGPVSSMIKITAMETLQRITELAVDVAGTPSLTLQLEALVVGSEVPTIGPEQVLTVMPSYLNNRAATIFGGSSEIQRNIIAKMLLSR